MSAQHKIFDSHLHIIDKQFPLLANHGYLPDEFTVEQYLQSTSGYQLQGGAIVSGSFQAFDQSYLVNALRKLGPKYVGVAQLPASVSDQEIIELDNCGVRAVRFNIKRGGSEQLDQLSVMAKRVYEIAAWHIELYIDSSALTDLSSTLLELPAVSIDHLGLSHSGFAALLKLAEQGVRVKATGFSRVDFDIQQALEDLYSANPNALMFGTDLPSTRAPSPYQDADRALLIDTLANIDDLAVEKVLSQNAIDFYRPASTA